MGFVFLDKREEALLSHLSVLKMIKGMLLNFKNSQDANASHRDLHVVLLSNRILLKLDMLSRNMICSLNVKQIFSNTSIELYH